MAFFVVVSGVIIRFELFIYIFEPLVIVPLHVILPACVISNTSAFALLLMDKLLAVPPNPEP